MSFKQLNLRSSYNSATTNILEVFYNPVLSQTVKYNRITGYFDSTSLAVATKGIYNLIKNNGHMKILCGVQLSQEDLDSILIAEDLKDLINEKFLKDLSKVDDKLKLGYLKLLGWMIANDYVEIKIGIKICDNEILGGNLRSKIGILYDKAGNYLTFTGINNETSICWKYNIDSFKVFLSWDESEKFTEDNINTFKKFWNNNRPNLKVMNIPNDSKEALIKLAPKSEYELEELILKISNSQLDRQLFKHQKEAIKAWFEHGKKGIFEMATGTGKTFTALKCLEKILKEEDNVLTVITCPFAHLVEQWADDVYSLKLGKVYRLYGSGNHRWRADLETLMFDLELGLVKNPIILTTHNTYSNDFFIEKIQEYSKKTFLIADEMHHLGAETFSEGLLSCYDYKLGLSATPQKYMDEEATDFIVNYFGGVVYKFDILKALNSRNPITHQTYLTPYEYYPEKVDLTIDELKEYEELSRKINFSIVRDKDLDDDEQERLDILRFKRRAIVNNAVKKYDLLHKILQKMDHPDHLIIFCSDKQLPNVMKILDEENVIPKHRFTKDEDAKKSKKYEGISQREYLLQEFDKGKYKVLVAIKCLNEGVDVPSADKVIIMSSTTNPIEYVQRRGRVLRRYPGKDKAYIYDIVVIPKIRDTLAEGIINNELNRLMDFIQTADNKGSCSKKLKKWGVLGAI